MARSDNPTFTEKQAQKIWTDYLQQVESLCGLLDKRQKADIQMELKATPAGKLHSDGHWR